MTIREEIGSEVVDAAQELEEQMKVERIRSEERPEFETEGGEKRSIVGVKAAKEAIVPGRKE